MRQNILKAAATIAKGGVILTPTDTVWGLSADACNRAAVQKVFDLKQRDESKAMIVLVKDINQLREFVLEVPNIVIELLANADRPTTVIYPASRKLPSILLAKDNTVAIRIPKFPFLQELLGTLKNPIVSTSANISGSPTPPNFASVSQEIKDGVDYIVNPLSLSLPEICDTRPSTIVKLRRDGMLETLRT